VYTLAALHHSGVAFSILFWCWVSISSCYRCRLHTSIMSCCIPSFYVACWLPTWVWAVCQTLPCTPFPRPEGFWVESQTPFHWAMMQCSDCHWLRVLLSCIVSTNSVFLNMTYIACSICIAYELLYTVVWGKHSYLLPYYGRVHMMSMMICSLLRKIKTNNIAAGIAKIYALFFTAWNYNCNKAAISYVITTINIENMQMWKKWYHKIVANNMT